MSTIAKIAERIEKELENAQAGLYVNYAPQYRAIAEEIDDGYLISYFRTDEEMPAFNAEKFDKIEDCVKEMVKIATEWHDVATIMPLLVEFAKWCSDRAQQHAIYAAEYAIYAAEYAKYAADSADSADYAAKSAKPADDEERKLQEEWWDEKLPPRP